jgi:hypothetical protein
MLKRIALSSLVVLFALAVMAGSVGAAAVANTSQKGSLLIFPKIVAKGDQTTGEAIVDTIIYIGNDSTVEVFLKCFWVAEDGVRPEFEFKLAPNQPVAFSAWGGTGTLSAPPFRGEGELVCWATDPLATTQIQFNHLYGSILIKSPFALVGANAWSFRALKDPSPTKGGIAGKLPLDGVTYDACPKYLVANFSPAEQMPIGLEPDLTLSLCRKDLRTYEYGYLPCAKAKFDIWNADESKFTGYQCLRWWYEGLLDRMGNDPSQKGPGSGGDNFTFDLLKTFAARFQVRGVYGAGCVGKTDGCYPASWGDPGKTTPFVGVMLYSFTIRSNDTFISIPYAAYSLNGALADTSGVILWSPSAGPIE